MGVNASYTFNLNIYNPPRFQTKLSNTYEVNIMNKIELRLHLIEEFHPITIVHKDLPSFVTFRDRNYTVRPIKI